jgi:hypothetical protein
MTKQQVNYKAIRIMNKMIIETYDYWAFDRSILYFYTFRHQHKIVNQ